MSKELTDLQVAAAMPWLRFYDLMNEPTRTEAIRQAFKAAKEAAPKTDLERFINALKILRAIDRDELDAAGLVLNDSRWVGFREKPVDFLLFLPDADRAIVWSLIEARS